MKIQLRKRKYVFFGVSLFLAASSLLYACGTKQNNQEGGAEPQSKQEERILYYKKNTLNQYSVSEEKSTEIAKGNYTNMLDYGEIFYSALYSEDGRYLYFIDYDKTPDYSTDGVLRVKDLQNPEESPKKISSSVGEIRLLKNGKLLYVKSSNQGLYLWDGEDSNKISGSMGGYHLSEDESKVIFTVDKTNPLSENYDLDYYSIQDLYYADLDEEVPERKKVAQDLTNYLGNTLDLSRAYFEVLEEDGIRFYCLKDLKELIKVDDQEPSSVLINENTGNIYYQKQNEQIDAYDFLVEDDLADADLEVKAPVITPEDIEKMAAEGRVIQGKGLKEFALKTLHEEFRENLKLNMASGSIIGGEYCYFDGKRSVKLQDMAEEIFLEGRPNFDIAFIKSLDKNKLEKQKFSELFDLYLKKLYLDVSGSLWEEDAGGMDLDRLIYEYYKDAESPLGMYFSLGKGEFDNYGNNEMQEEVLPEDYPSEETLLYEERYSGEDRSGAEEYGNEAYDYGSEAYDYGSEAYDYEGMYEDTYDPSYGWDYEYIAGSASYAVFQEIDQKLSEIKQYYILQGEKSEEFQGLQYVNQIMASEQEDVIYYTLLSEEDQKLKKKLELQEGFEETLDYQYTLFCREYQEGGLGEEKKIDENVQHIEEMHQGEVYYLKDMDRNYYSGALYKSGEKLEDDVADVYIIEDQVYVLSDPDSYDSFNLYHEKEGEMIEIADEVHSFVVLKDGKIGYISDYNSMTEKGNLYIRDQEGKVKEIDQNVKGMIDQLRYYGLYMSY